MRGYIEDEIEITGYHLLGYSLGATYAAFVARLDGERRSFDFDKVLLINPPVNLYWSARVLDQFFEEHIPSIAAFNALFKRLIREFSQFYSPAEPMLFSDELVYEIYQRSPPPESTLEALIGAAFRLSSMNLVFTSDVMAHDGVLVAPEQKLAITDSLTPYLKASMEISFEDYARRVLYPEYLETSPDGTFEQLIEEDSLRVIGDYLRATSKIGLMHNADDPLVNEDDIEYLESVFGERAQIYPTGGHVGNLAYKDNIAYIIDFFTD
jgi:predicted alpha/beta-fold hydrolase